jgi:hypothetical protein
MVLAGIGPHHSAPGHAAVRRHLNRLTARDHIMVPAPVAAQVVRNPRRQAT